MVKKRLRPGVHFKPVRRGEDLFTLHARVDVAEERKTAKLSDRTGDGKFNFVRQSRFQRSVPTYVTKLTLHSCTAELLFDTKSKTVVHST